jgi:hypothetical protein
MLQAPNQARFWRASTLTSASNPILRNAEVKNKQFNAKYGLSSRQIVRAFHGIGIDFKATLKGKQLRNKKKASFKSLLES